MVPPSKLMYAADVATVFELIVMPLKKLLTVERSTTYRVTPVGLFPSDQFTVR